MLSPEDRRRVRAERLRQQYQRLADTDLAADVLELRESLASLPDTGEHGIQRAKTWRHLTQAQSEQRRRKTDPG